MLEIGVQTKGIIDSELDAVQGFQTIREAGFSCVDFNLDAFLNNSDVYAGKLNRFFDSEPEQMMELFCKYRAAMDQAGIRASQMHAPYPVRVVGNPQVSQYMQTNVVPKSILIAEILGAPWVVVHPFKLQYTHGKGQEWTENIEYFEQLIPLLKQCGVGICFENLYESVGGRITEGVCADPAEAVRYVDTLNEKAGAEWFGMCLDTGHLQLAKQDVAQYIRTVGNRIKIFHLHENDAVYDLHQMPFTFGNQKDSGQDWDGFIRALREIGYRGTLSFETFPCMNAYPYEIRGEVLRTIYEIGRYLAERIEE